MSRQAFAASLALAAALTSSHAFSAVIAQNTAGTFLNAAAFWGQSFTTPSGGPWDDTTFNFFSNVPATTPVAFGAAFLLDQQYLGTPSNLSVSTPGFLGASAGITGGMYVFPTALVLDPGVQYFVYENEPIPAGDITGGNTITGGQDYFAPNASSDFAAGGLSANFSVSGTVVPEPSSLMVLVTALFGFGLLRPYRKSS
jgi:hypothetical protein